MEDDQEAATASPDQNPENNRDNLPENTSLFQQDIVARPIYDEMSESYLDYAMSVIVSRALPDVRDGLKPVHRRIMFSMHGLGLRSSAKFSKSARTVGDVIAKYHPHGDAAVYDSLVRLAQDFSLRHPLIRGQGNFGSIDGDSAAAMRYTESKLEKISDEMLADIEKETVRWQDNYDGTIQEPTVLPTKVPNLLLNGSMGIAVGMATNIPPHNLGELVDALIHLINNPEATIDDLLEFIQGPDFPTAGIIYDKEAIKNMYINGRGGIVIRSVANIEERKGGKFAIIITEIPYQVNKATMVSKIAELVRDKKIVGISDLRDESNREGIRVVIELKKDAYPKKILNQLFKLTPMQSSFNMNMIALVDGIQPRLLNLKLVLEYFIRHRFEVITKRTEFELKVAKARAHILEGLKIALDNIDAVIETIRKSETKEEAHAALIKKFKLSDKQASAILEMRLQTLAGLERKKIEDELKEKMNLIAELESILADEKKIFNIISEELISLKENYANPRRTKVVPTALGKFSSTDVIPDSPMIVCLSEANYIKRMTPDQFKIQNRGGKGVIGATTKDEDEIKEIVDANNHDQMMYFTNTGRVFKLPVYEIPQGTRTGKGVAIVNLLQLGESEYITAMFKLPKVNEGFMFMATANGTVKKTPIKDFENVRKTGLIAIKLRDGDSLKWVKTSIKGDQMIMVSKNGQCIRFDESDVRPMGRASTGVRGMKLKGDDRVVEMTILKGEKKDELGLLIVTENGLSKRSPLSEYRSQNRGGSGIKTCNVTQKTGKIVGALIFNDKIDANLLIVSKRGQAIRLNPKQVPLRGRATQGVYVMRVKQGDTVSSISYIINEVEAAGSENPPSNEGDSRQTLL